MISADLIGWTAAMTGVLVALPQLVRLARTRNVAGLSLIAWQSVLAGNLGWAVHGLRIGQPPQYATALLSLGSTLPILFLLARALRRNLVVVLLPGVAFAAVMIGADVVGGSAAFGAIAVVQGFICGIGQSVELVRAPDIRGVSGVFLTLSLGSLILWLVWAMRIDDPGTFIAGITNSTIALFNLVWHTMRRLGVRPLFSQPLPDATPDLAAYAEPEVAAR